VQEEQIKFPRDVLRASFDLSYIFKYTWFLSDMRPVMEEQIRKVFYLSPIKKYAMVPYVGCVVVGFSGMQHGDG